MALRCHSVAWIENFPDFCQLVSVYAVSRVPVRIGRTKPADSWVVIPRPEINSPCLFVKVLAAVAERGLIFE